MRSLTSKLLVLGLAAFVSAPIAVGGCATSDVPVDDSTDDTGSTTVKKDSGTTKKKDSGTTTETTDDTGTEEDSGTTVKDSGVTPKDSGVKDASTTPKDSGVFPAEGSSCSTAGEQVEKPCGMCGYAKSFCGGTPGALTWQPYGFCDQPAGAECVAGTVDTGACGNCGTQPRVCQSDCHFQLGSCTEPMGACPAGLRKFNVGLSCPVGPNSGREQECDSTCKWALPGDCTTRATSLTLPTTVGGKVNEEFALTATSTQLAALPTYGSTCPISSISSFSNYSYAYVTVTNPSAKAATVSLWTAQAFGGPTFQSNIAVYSRNTPPVTETERKTCSVLNTGCTTAPCDTSGDWAGFVGANALKISAGTTVTLFVYPTKATDTGTFQVYATVDALN